MAKKFWQLKAQSDTGTAELLLYGEISSYSWWGDEVTPKQFKEDLDSLGDVNEIKVFINSGGGDVFAGQAIHSMLKRHKAKISVYVDGLAASIASVIAMAGDTIYMPRNALMMIHNPWTWGTGTAKDFRKLADDMDKAAEGIIATYEDKAGLDRESIIALMDAETWMTAEEAKGHGFIDIIENEKEIAASMSGNTMMFNGQNFDTSQFKNVPKLVVLSNRAPVSDPPEPKDEQLNNEVLSLYQNQIQINKNKLLRG